MPLLRFGALVALLALAAACGGDDSGSPPALVCGPMGDDVVLSCPDGYTCEDTVCVCAPSCIGRECGDDGCGGFCGDCPAGEVCFRHPWGPTSECCVPHCEGMKCGDDGCGGSCGGCSKGEVCRLSGTCCVPQCDGRQCGDDGCDGNCGLCPEGYACKGTGGSAKCKADCPWFCDKLECGPGGHSGECDCGKCEDWDPCTIDECTWGTCSNTRIEGCCRKDSDCLDCVDKLTGASCPVAWWAGSPTCPGDDCVPNSCTEHVCAVDEFCDLDPESFCCVDDWDCDDENPCSEDKCILETHYCIRIFEDGCCANDGMCNDGNICTYNVCQIPAGELTGACEFPPVPDCCDTAANCPPKTCKKAVCQNGNCLYMDIEGCCLHDAECWDDDLCTVDKCVNGWCVHMPSGAEGCD
ncbi:MAG: hypothetical protein ABIK09_06975 [Pseudomonadota bacterium]